MDIGAFLLSLALGFALFVAAQAGLTTSHADAARSHHHYISPLLVLADLAAGVACCLAVWGRRRWPFGVALALAPITVFSAMAAGPSLVATFGLAARRPLRRVLIVAALLVISAPLYNLIRPDGDAASIAITPVILAGVIGWGTSVRARREQQDLRVEQARQNERTRIAREMHDVLGHRLSLLSLHAGALGYGAEKSPQDTARAVAVIRESAHQALDELRAVIGVLREDGEHGAPEPPQPQLADLPALVEETRRAGMPVDTSVEVDFSTAPPVAGRHAYRIVQEGLTNARKHAYGAAVALRVEGAAGAGLEVELRNGLPDGVTLPAAGAGLLGLSERAALAGGRLEHGVTVNGDFRLWAWLPWPA